MNGWVAVCAFVLGVGLLLTMIRRSRRAERSVLAAVSASRSILWKAFLQLLVIWVCSNLPIAMAVLFERYSKGAGTFSWTASLANNLNAGEVFIYCAALVAPFAWTFVQYFHQQRKFFLWWVPGILAAISTFLGAVVFAIARLSGDFDTGLVINTGIFLYAISIVVWYWSLVADIQLTEPESPYKHERRAVDEMVSKLGGGQE